LKALTMSGSYLAARHASVERDASSAATFYRSALRTDPKNNELLDRAFISSLADGDIEEAVNAPRFHHQWLPDQILVEDRLSPDTMNVLRSKGHKLAVRHFWGDGECIMVNPTTGERLAGADGRNNGKAVGY